MEEKTQATKKKINRISEYVYNTLADVEIVFMPEAAPNRGASYAAGIDARACVLREQ